MRTCNVQYVIPLLVVYIFIIRLHKKIIIIYKPPCAIYQITHYFLPDQSMKPTLWIYILP